MWWKVFASHWNGTSLFIPARPPDIMITSDASAWIMGLCGMEPAEVVPVAVGRKYSKQTHFSKGAGAYRNCNPYVGPSVCEDDSLVQLRQLCSSICPHESHQQRQRYDAAPALPVLPRSIFSVPPCSPSHSRHI